jgi:hypothetical protein
VRFVDAGGEGLFRSFVLEDVSLGGRWIPEASVVDGGDGEVLGDAFDPGGDAFLSVVVVRCDEGDL